MLNSALYFIKDIKINQTFPFNKYLGLELYRDADHSKTDILRCSLWFTKNEKATCNWNFSMQHYHYPWNAPVNFHNKPNKKRDLLTGSKAWTVLVQSQLIKKFPFSSCKPGFWALVMEYHWQCRLKDFLLLVFFSFKTTLLPDSYLQHKFRAAVLLLKCWKINKCKHRSVKKCSQNLLLD